MEWEGVRHPFCPDRVRPDSKWPLYTLLKDAWHDNDILKVPKFKINSLFKTQNL